MARKTTPDHYITGLYLRKPFTGFHCFDNEAVPHMPKTLSRYVSNRYRAKGAANIQAVWSLL